MRTTALLLTAAILATLPNLGVAQTTTAVTGSERKIATRVPPTYPELAKKMHIRGLVRVEALVQPNGKVKSTRVLGGNPVLVQAAQDAVARFKFEPAQSETTEVVQLAFEDQ